MTKANMSRVYIIRPTVRIFVTFSKIFIINVLIRFDSTDLTFYRDTHSITKRIKWKSLCTELRQVSKV